MSFSKLLLRNLLFHRRGNFAVLLGVAVGTAVLTGALLVGDSLRGSLRDLTEERLGWVDDAMVTGRFEREGLVTKIVIQEQAQEDGKTPASKVRASSAIILKRT